MTTTLTRSSRIVIDSKSHPELFEQLTAQLRIQRLRQLSSSISSTQKNRAKRLRKKSKR